MTPKEKARELVDKMNGFTFEDCKGNSLTCVDEILDLGILYGDAPFGDYGKRFYSYWKDVKQEIEKL